MGPSHATLWPQGWRLLEPAQVFHSEVTSVPRPKARCPVPGVRSHLGASSRDSSVKGECRPDSDTRNGVQGVPHADHAFLISPHLRTAAKGSLGSSAGRATRWGLSPLTPTQSSVCMSSCLLEEGSDE